MLIGTLMMSQMLFQIELSNLKFNREVYELLCIVIAFWNIISMMHRHISLIHTLRHAISALRQISPTKQHTPSDDSRNNNLVMFHYEI